MYIPVEAKYYYYTTASKQCVFVLNSLILLHILASPEKLLLNRLVILFSLGKEERANQTAVLIKYFVY